MKEHRGTQMYCTKCKEITVCKAIPLSHIGLKSSQQLYDGNHTDLQWFRRARECQRCNEVFVTSEIPETFLTELTELRNTIVDIKKNAKNAKEYMKNTVSAINSLEKLNDSLNEILNETKLTY